MMMKDGKFIQAVVSSDTHRRFQNHPSHRGRNQRPFAGEILKKWVESPEAQLPVLKEELRILSDRLLWLTKQVNALSALEARVVDVERRIDAGSPSAAAAS